MSRIIIEKDEWSLASEYITKQEAGRHLETFNPFTNEYEDNIIERR